MPAKKTTAKKTTAKKTTAKKRVAKSSASKKSTVKNVARKSTPPKAVAGKRIGRARRGDRIVIPSQSLGSPPREGQVLSVVGTGANPSYRVKWADGHESFMSPSAGTVTIVRP